VTASPRPTPPEGALDEVLDAYDRAQKTIRAKPDHPPECDDCERADRMSAAARAELAELRQRASDLELMLRAGARPSTTRWYACEDTERLSPLVRWELGFNKSFSMQVPEGPDGLPLLDDAARSALRRRS
jgi:hypothetical protein